MKTLTRIGLLTLATSFAVTVVVAMMIGGSSAAADGYVDLTVEMEAPAHIDISSTYVVRIAYFNYGTAFPTDARVTAVLPEGTQLITSTDRWGAPLLPDTADGVTLTWDFDTPQCHMPLDACCGHIVLTLRADEDILESTTLTTTASISTSDVESDLSNNQASVASVVGDMGGSKKQVHARHVTPAGAIDYTITISLAHQPGGENQRWVALTDTLPFSHQVRFLGWSGTMTGAQIDGHTLSWQGQVKAGEPLVLQYRLGVESVVTPGTVITNVAMLGWGNGHMRLGPVTTVVTLPHDVMVLEPDQGGQLVHSHGVTLVVPPGAVSETTVFRLGPLFTDTYPSSPPGNLLFANRAFELTASRFGDPVRAFSRPLTITMNYTDADIDGLKRETVQLLTRSGPDGPWAVLSEPVRMMSGTLAFSTTHFSQFALFGDGIYRFFLPLITR